MKHNNASIVSWANKIFSPKGENLNPAIADFIQPTIEVKPYNNIVRNGGGTGTTTLFTTPTDKDFFLTAVSLSAYNTGATTASHARIQVTIDGAVRQIIVVSIIPSTTSANNAEMSFQPIKIDRGTNIQIAGDNTFGGAQACIIGYTQETLSTNSN